MLGGFLLAACASPAAKPAPAAPAPAEPTDCTCAQLTAPVAGPSTHERVRWEHTATEVEVVLSEVARVMALPCPATVDADVSQIFAAHAAALADHRALNTSTCDHFARWAEKRMDGDGEHEIAIMQSMRSGECEVSKAASDQLDALLIIRSCTTVSGNIDLDHRRGFTSQHDERQHVGAQRDHRQERVDNPRH